VDNNTGCIEFVKEFSEKHFPGMMYAMRNDAFRYIKNCHTTFDIIFADPPFSMSNVWELPDLILEQNISETKTAGFILEHSSHSKPTCKAIISETRKYGHTSFSFFKPLTQSPLLWRGLGVRQNLIHGKNCCLPRLVRPITVRDADILDRALPIFDKYSLRWETTMKKNICSRLTSARSGSKTFIATMKKIKIIRYDGLTIDFCRRVSAHYIIRRHSALRPDFEFERMIAQMNSQMAAEIETVFFISRPEYSHISSTVVRDIIRNKGDYKKVCA